MVIGIFFLGCPGEDIDWLSRITDHFYGGNIKSFDYYYRFHTEALTRNIHKSVKARHINEIIGFLQSERENFLIDSIDTNNQTNHFSDFLKKLEQPYKDDSQLMNRKVCFDYATKKRISPIN
ncbi:hypothetical protein AYY23_11510 [Photobacterium kishitanii]|nr:hypothetical protein AYY23_11510 [Photobacterium kishitanii]